MIKDNREEFLEKLAIKLGREFNPNPPPVSPVENDYRKTRLTELTRAELLANYVNYSRSIGITVEVCKQETLCDTLVKEVERLGGGPVVFNHDPRLLDCGIVDSLTNKDIKSFIWNKELDRQNIQNCQESNVGVTFAEAGLTETGTIILESGEEYGRSVSLLPKYSVVVLKSSTVYPRMAQYCEDVDNRVKLGKRVPSVINLISGPSSTADIELVKVVGVHGPIDITYILVDDENSCTEIANS